MFIFYFFSPLFSFPSSFFIFFPHSFFLFFFLWIVLWFYGVQGFDLLVQPMNPDDGSPIGLATYVFDTPLIWKNTWHFINWAVHALTTENYVSAAIVKGTPRCCSVPSTGMDLLSHVCSINVNHTLIPALQALIQPMCLPILRYSSVPAIYCLYYVNYEQPCTQRQHCGWINSEMVINNIPNMLVSQLCVWHLKPRGDIK